MVRIDVDITVGTVVRGANSMVKPTGPHAKPWSNASGDFTMLRSLATLIIALEHMPAGSKSASPGLGTRRRASSVKVVVRGVA
jgi:hypothetical protein